MSSLTVSGGGGGGTAGGVTEDRVREIVNEMISGSMTSLGTILADTINGNITT
jgi:chemotaxis protein CheY-P-specific phosphatase CheC